MNRKGYRIRLADTHNHPNRGAKGTNRLNRIINYALKRIWADLPIAMLSEEHRFPLEPPVTGLVIASDGTDRLTFSVTGSFLTSAGASDPAVYRGRTLEVQAPGGQYHYFTIRDFSGQPPVSFYIIVDKPWDGAADTDMPGRILTREYPYPPDVQSIHKVWFSPENQPAVVLRPLTREGIDKLNWLNGARTIGQPQAYARGDFYQQPAPHYTPGTATYAQPANDQRWGFNPSGGAEHGATNPNQPYYGPAGTFSYKVCHVLGRQRWPLSLRDTPDAWSRKPWYISAPSEASPQTTTTWGGSAIQVTSPDIGYLDGYGPYNNRISYQRSGLEKWWFRARHATEDPTSATNNAFFKQAENTEAYYLWAVTDAHVTTITDHGQYDPVERNYLLKDFYGHNHLRFDRLPSTADFVRLHVSRRPPQLEYDTDVPRIPPEIEPILMNLLSAYVVGTLDGKPDRKSAYYLDYLRDVERLRQEYGLPGDTDRTFGDGLSAARDVGGRWDNIQEIP